MQRCFASKTKHRARKPLHRLPPPPCFRFFSFPFPSPPSFSAASPPSCSRCLSFPLSLSSLLPNSHPRTAAFHAPSLRRGKKISSGGGKGGMIMSISCMAEALGMIDSRILTMPRRTTPAVHRPGTHSLHPPRKALRYKPRWGAGGRGVTIESGPSHPRSDRFVCSRTAPYIRQIMI